MHRDSLQFYGSGATAVIRGNYFRDFESGSMAPDGGSNEQITDNVIIGASGYRAAIQLGGHRNSLFAHNVTKNLDVYVDAQGPANPAGTDNVVRDNVLVGRSRVAADRSAPVHRSPTTCSRRVEPRSGTNAIVGTPVLYGRPEPDDLGRATRWCAGSPGIGNGERWPGIANRPGSEENPPPPDRDADSTDADRESRPRGLPRRPRSADPTPTPTAVPHADARRLSPTPTATATPSPTPAKANWTPPTGVVTGQPVVLDGTRLDRRRARELHMELRERERARSCGRRWRLPDHEDVPERRHEVRRV